MDELSFDEARHEYAVSGRVLPGVTSIIADMGLIETRWFTEEGRERGTLVHKTCELYDKGTLDEESLDPRLIPYLSGWKAFLHQTGAIIVDAEIRGVSKFGYAGTDERFGGTRDRLAVDKRGKMILIDIKSSLAKSPWIGIQLGFYQQLAEEAGHRIDERWSVHLPGNGTFRIETWPDRKNDALAVWRAHQIKKECAK